MFTSENGLVISLKHLLRILIVGRHIWKIEQYGAPAILGIGETGKANDTEIIESYL